MRLGGSRGQGRGAAGGGGQLARPGQLLAPHSWARSALSSQNSSRLPCWPTRHPPPTCCARCAHSYHRIEVLGALASVLTVWLVTGVLVFEAVNRIINPEPVNGKSERGGEERGGAGKSKGSQCKA